MAEAYFCAELSQDGQCLEWVEYSSIFMLPEGAGMEIGAALLLCTITAWGISFIARVILNR